MKKIKIYQKNSQPIELFDNSDVDMSEYCKDLSKVFQVSNVVILKTSEQTFIGRPSQLTGLIVEEDKQENEDSLLIDDIDEIEENDNITQEEDSDIPETKEEEIVAPSDPSTEKVEEDIITDMD
jgi:hypothetical protein